MISFRSILDYENDIFSIHEDVNEMSERMQAVREGEPQSDKVYVWSGFGSLTSNRVFRENAWLKDFVGLFSDEEMWPWKYRLAINESDRTGNKELIEVLESNRLKSIIASLRIRNFDSGDRFRGSIEWFEEIFPYLNNEYYASRALVDSVVESLLAAREAGIHLYLEKISLIVNQDPQNPITLTPHLHRDGAYGYLESAIVSYYSEHDSPNASTLFFPNFDFDTFSHLKPITADTLIKYFPNATAYKVDSGGLAIFSGKMSDDGTKSDERGALHMSPEGFFSTRRLVLLFRSCSSC